MAPTSTEESQVNENISAKILERSKVRRNGANFKTLYLSSDVQAIIDLNCLCCCDHVFPENVTTSSHDALKILPPALIVS